MDYALEDSVPWYRMRLTPYSEYIFIGILVALYLFFSNYFAWGSTFVNGGGIATLPTSGGSDPYYNFRVILYILQTHHELIYDPALNYPLGSINPRNPFFHWLIVLVAELLGPLMGTQNAAFYAFEELDAVFGALLIIPVYLITKHLFGKTAGYIGALLYTLMPS
ncbi:MAG TPA: STT3 domain-containing protein, partial [Thermoplasmataceae archaeon]|nr:STT3 domain-containing protein [Thermoplasmataceae archaeon]